MHPVRSPVCCEDYDNDLSNVGMDSIKKNFMSRYMMSVIITIINIITISFKLTVIVL